MNPVEDTKQRLLDAAGPVFAEKGFAEATVREICTRAKANIAAVNYYFRDKEQLYAETLRRAHCMRLEKMPPPDWPPGTPPERKLQGFLHALVTSLVDDNAPPWFIQLMLREMTQPSPAGTELVKEFIRPQFEFLQGIIREMVGDEVPEMKRHMIGFSIVGQAMYYKVARNVASTLVGEKEFREYTVERLTQHIYEFSLAAMGWKEAARPAPEEGDGMNWVAYKMLTGDKAKYFGIIFGIAFACLLMGQQMSIFCGLMNNTTSQIRDIEGADIWVMDANVQFIDDLKPMSDNELYRVRGVSGVAWTARLYKGLARARLENGNFQQVIMLGLDDNSLVGAPREITQGSLADLKQPDAVIMDEAGFRYLWPNEQFSPGRVVEMNDRRRAVIVGLCKSSPTFQTFPIVYARFSQAIAYVPGERKVLSFVLAQGETGLEPHEVCRRIEQQTGLQAITRDDFRWKTIGYYMKRTGIPINFGITVALGFFVGCAIAGQTFYLFTLENLKQFGALKAMGLGNFRIIGMILLQAAVVGAIGYGIGIGMAAFFGWAMGAAVKTVPPAFLMPWQVPALTAVGVVIIAIFSSLLSIRKVLVLEPAVVFR